MSTPLLFCVEYYRTDSQVGDADDYMVDGLKLFTLACVFTKPEEDDQFAFIEGVKTSIATILKDFLAAFEASDLAFNLQRAYPGFCRLRRSGQGYWVHVTSPQHLASLPTEFNSRGFTDEQLLGVDPEASAAELDSISFYFNSAGDPIEGPPDKFMLSIGAV